MTCSAASLAHRQRPLHLNRAAGAGAEVFQPLETEAAAAEEEEALPLETAEAQAEEAEEAEEERRMGGVRLAEGLGGLTGGQRGLR